MADTRDMNLIASMISTGGCYLDSQQQQGDTESTAKMESVLQTLNDMLSEEIKEPAPPTDSMGGMSAMEGY